MTILSFSCQLSIKPISDGSVREIDYNFRVAMGFSILYITYTINGLVMICAPVLLGLWLTRKFNLGWRLYGIGAATFLLSQVFHLPFNSLLNTLFLRGILPLPPIESRVAFNAIVGGLSAGIFEETARYIMYRWFAKDARSWRKGLLAGAGHGGIESIIVGLIFFISFFQLAAYRGQDLSKLVPPAQLPQLQATVQAFWSLPWYDSLLGAVERIVAITIHLSLSIMVLQVFIRRQPIWLFLAIGWHALWDGVIVYAAMTWGMHPSIAIEVLSALLALGIIFALRQPEPTEHLETSPEAPPPLVIPIKPMEETPDNLDQTRYQ